jgi:hypothetical protein
MDAGLLLVLGGLVRLVNFVEVVAKLFRIFSVLFTVKVLGDVDLVFRKEYRINPDRCYADYLEDYLAYASNKTHRPTNFKPRQ